MQSCAKFPSDRVPTKACNSALLHFISMTFGTGHFQMLCYGFQGFLATGALFYRGYSLKISFGRGLLDLKCSLYVDTKIIHMDLVVAEI